MKKKSLFLYIIIILIAVFIILIKTRDYRYKSKIFSFVNNNYYELEEYVEDFIKSNKSQGEFKNIKVYKSPSDQNFIDFYFKSYGLSNSRLIYGFYYSKDGNVFDKTEVKPKKVDNYWIAKSDKSDDSAYMEQIKGKWFYFKYTD